MRPRLQPSRWNYIDSTSEARHCIDATDASYTFCGHLHDQVLYFESGTGTHARIPADARQRPFRFASHRRWLAIVGTVGQPRDRNPAAAYTLFDRERQEITFHRVAYDAAAAADKIRKCGLPASLAYRVELGI